MSTPARALAAQINGAKSAGPVTLEGRERSSRNAISHGLASSLVVLPGESHEEYDGLLRALMQRYQPRDEHASALVQEMAACSWRLRRSAALEARMIDAEAARIAADPEQDVNPDHVVGRAFINLAGKSGALSQLHRHEARLQRSYDRAMRQLLDIAAQQPTPALPTTTRPPAAPVRPPAPEKQKLQNEPNVRRLMGSEVRTRVKENGFPDYFIG